MTDAIDVTLAPGCFGGPLTFLAGSRECEPCMFRVQCEALAVPALEAHRVRHAIPLPAPKPKDPLAGSIAGLVRFLKTADRPVIDFVMALRGERVKPRRYLIVICQLLRQSAEGFSRDTLIRALEIKLSWSRREAATHVTVTIEALRELQVVEEINGRFKLKGQT